MSKRRRPASGLLLFDGDIPPDYVVDASSWIYLYERKTLLAQLWPTVEALILADRMFSPSRVVGTKSELGEVISARDLVEPHIERLTRCDRNDIPFLMKVGEITRKYRRLSKPTGPKTKADPYVVAYGSTGYTVVAEESMRHPHAKIIGVCRLEKIPCYTIEQVCEVERKRERS